MNINNSKKQSSATFKTVKNGGYAYQNDGRPRSEFKSFTQCRRIQLVVGRHFRRILFFRIAFRIRFIHAFGMRRIDGSSNVEVEIFWPLEIKMLGKALIVTRIYIRTNTELTTEIMPPMHIETIFPVSISKSPTREKS